MAPKVPVPTGLVLRRGERPCPWTGRAADVGRDRGELEPARAGKVVVQGVLAVHPRSALHESPTHQRVRPGVVEPGLQGIQLRGLEATGAEGLPQRIVTQ